MEKPSAIAEKNSESRMQSQNRFWTILRRILFCVNTKNLCLRCLKFNA